MPWLSGPFVAAALLLVLGGGAKARRPDTTVRALRSLRLPSSRALVRLLAVAEVVVGAGAVLTGARPMALLVAASYGAFSAFVLFAMARGGVVSSCGCFGTPDTPPTLSHLLITMAAAGVSVGFADDPAPLLGGLGDQPLWGLPFLALTGCCLWFAYLALTALPNLAAAVSRRTT